MVAQITIIAHNATIHYKPALGQQSGIRQLSRVLYKSTLFMQNKANFGKAQMNTTICVTKDYANMCSFGARKNKANSKPISRQPEGLRRAHSAQVGFFEMLESQVVRPSNRSNSHAGYGRFKHHGIVNDALYACCDMCCSFSLLVFRNVSKQIQSLARLYERAEFRCIYAGKADEALLLIDLL